MKNRYVIEARRPDGSLDLSGRQPEEVFGLGAVKGIDDWAMSRVIFRLMPDAVLRGDEVARWPSLIDPRWVARPKTW